MLIEVDVMFEERFDLCVRVGLCRRVKFFRGVNCMRGMRNEGTEVFK